MTAQEIYDTLHKIDVIAELETKHGVWYIENSIDEYHARPSSYYPTLMECIEGLQESSDWFCPIGTGMIHFREFGREGKDFMLYSGGYDNKWGELWV